MIISNAFIGSVVTSTTGECYTVTSNFELIETVTWSGNEIPSTYGVDCNECQTSNPCPTPSVTPSVSITRTPTVTPSITPTTTATPSISFTPTMTATPSVTKTPSVTPSISFTPTMTATPSVTKTPSITPTVTPSITPSITPSVTANVSPTPFPTPTATPSITVTATPSITPSTSQPAGLIEVLLAYSSKNEFTACNGAAATYYSDNSNLNNMSVLWTDAAGTIAAPAGYYSDTVVVRYWNGTDFIGFPVFC